jgi:predicted ester cyclase
MGRVEQNKALARREIEEFEGDGDVSLAPLLFAADYTLTFADAPAMDHVGHEHLLAALRGAFPDLRIRVAEQVAADERVANHWTARGTHLGPFQGIAATGKAVTFTGNNIMHLAAGRIRALWGQLDSFGLMTQLGAIPHAAPGRSDTGATESVKNGASGADDVVRFIGNFDADEVAAIGDEYDNGYVLDFPGGPAGADKAGLRRATRAFHAAFPDLSLKIEDVFSEGDRVAWRWAMTGTHLGALGSYAASGRPVRLNGITITEMIGGKIACDRVRADMAGLLAQIGAVPAATDAAR